MILFMSIVCVSQGFNTNRSGSCPIYPRVPKFDYKDVSALQVAVLYNATEESYKKANEFIHINPI